VGEIFLCPAAFEAGGADVRTELFEGCCHQAAIVRSLDRRGQNQLGKFELLSTGGTWAPRGTRSTGTDELFGMSATVRRRSRRAREREIFDKTDGHCHFCGDPLVFTKRGWSPRPNGNWEIDHVIQRKKGGHAGKDNCLPACTNCNRLRWGRTGLALREVLLMGVIALKEMRAGSRLGGELELLRERHLRANRNRRRKRRAASRR
jgi:HNH endonuclease